MTGDELTTIVTEDDESGASGWNPVVGDELLHLAQDSLDSDSARETLISRSLAILAKCVPPQDPDGSRTGLVVGKVQSGKTLSFTSVIAGAHDNSYRLVIVLAGTKKILAEQTRDRLLEDLRIEENALRPWRAYHNPDPGEAASIRGLLEMWDRPGIPPNLRHTAVLTVHKNPPRLSALTSLLQSIGAERLGSILVIDDEADQAGLNTHVRQGRRSPTYESILALRRTLPSHTYLQYTATPQGNLLISLLDLLSPDFAAVLQPGDDYVGGVEMFHSSHDLMEIIPPEDIPDTDDPTAEPPRSLHRAMRLFFVGVADWVASNFSVTKNRSMMIHPSQLMNSHEVYARWVQSRVRVWRQILEDESNPDRDAVVAEFRQAYEELGETVSTLHPFDEIVRLLPTAMQLTEVKVVNSSGSIDIPWRQHPAWLLVGGANLDRGFTVEGLTVTYMPRGPGVGNADTIQQRGRFFGYKRQYLGYCRVFLDGDVANAFRSYVRHERSIHDWLADSVAAGVPLNELPRRFLIDPALRPTRAAILSDDVARSSFRTEWFRQYTVLESLEDCRHNGSTFEAFIQGNSINLVPDAPQSEPDQRQPHQKHHIAEDVPLALLYSQLLTDLKIPGSNDTDRWVTALLLIESWLEAHPDELATVVAMRPGVTTARAVTQRQGAPSQLDNPFQGAYPDRGGAIYPGDMKVRSNRVTLQLHRIDLYRGRASGGELIERDVPVIALWLDRPLRQDMVTLGTQ